MSIAAKIEQKQILCAIIVRQWKTRQQSKNMNHWTKLSIDFANQRNYLDELFRVYPTIPDSIREIDEAKWKEVEKAFGGKDNVALLRSLLKLKLFPIKDSYVAYLKRDKESILRNPKTVKRLCSRLREMGLDKIWEKCSEPKETNRQIGPLFGNWLKKGELGLPLLNRSKFEQSTEDAILMESDIILKDFAEKRLRYKGDKRPDFIARVRNRYIVGEAKFLTDFGGHQNAQFEDAKAILKDTTIQATKIAVLDGVLYIPGKNKMYDYLNTHKEEYNIMSSLLLREFLFQF